MLQRKPDLAQGDVPGFISLRHGAPPNMRVGRSRPGGDWVACDVFVLRSDSTRTVLRIHRAK